jgi:hypothetical protein
MHYSLFHVVNYFKGSNLVQELIKSYPYQQLVSFGGYHEDFMLTVKREPSSLSTPDEPTKERLTFSMSRHSIAQVGSV